MQLVRERGIELETRLCLSRVDVERRVATFDRLNEAAEPTGETKEMEVGD